MTLRAVKGDGDKPKRGPGRPSGESFDPWQTEGLEYSPDKFYTRSTNNHDHSLRIEMRVPPHIFAQAKELVESKHFPSLRSMADLCRDALVHRLTYLNLDYTTPELEAMLDFEMREVRNFNRNQEINRLEKMVQDHRELLEKAARLGDIIALRGELDDMEDNTYMTRQPYKQSIFDLIAQYKPVLEGLLSGAPPDEQ